MKVNLTDVRISTRTVSEEEDSECNEGKKGEALIACSCDTNNAGDACVGTDLDISFSGDSRDECTATPAEGKVSSDVLAIGMCAKIVKN